MFGGVEKHMDGLSCIYMVEAAYVHDEKRLMVEEKMMAKEKTSIFKNCDNKTSSCSSSSTSSIGKNSDVSGISLDDDDDVAEDEVQSSYKSPLDAMQALEDVLPIRKGISRFYNGKSKSFASLADAASSKDLTKPENAYAKRRRNLLAYTMSWDKPTRSNSILRSSNGGIAKRVPGTTRNSSLAFAVVMNSLAESSSSDSLNSEHEMAPRSPPPSNGSRVHPRVRLLQMDCSAPPRGSLSAWRSYSHADLQECSSETTIAPIRKTETGPH